MKKQRVKIYKHGDVILDAVEIDEKTKVATVKIFGTLCKFMQHEYEKVEDK